MAKTVLKPSLQRFGAAYARVKRQIADERLLVSPNKEQLDRWKVEKSQLKTVLAHLQLPVRIQIDAPYVHNMVDAVLELVSQYLHDESRAMLRGGKNTTNRDYVRVQNEHNVVLAEQAKRKEVAEAVEQQAA